MADDYINNNQPVSTLTDAAQHMAREILFRKFDCSQAYHCLQMADQQSVKRLTFNFQSRTLAYRRLAKGLGRSLSAFFSCIRECLDPVIKGDHSEQHIDDFGIGANTIQQFIKNAGAVFQCLRKACYKLVLAKCHFEVQELDFLERTLTTKGVASQKQKMAKIVENVKFPKSKKQFNARLVFRTVAETTYLDWKNDSLRFFNDSPTDAIAKIPITPEIIKKFRENNETLDRCCQLALRQPLPVKQLVLLTDASIQAAGYAMLFEDDPNQKYTSARKTYPPIAYDSKAYTPSQIKMSVYAKGFSSLCLAFKVFGHLFWGAAKPVFVITDSKSVTRFFQIKMIPPPLWND